MGQSSGYLILTSTQTKDGPIECAPRCATDEDCFKDTCLDVLLNGPGQPATKAFCEEWVKEYSLTIPVMIDPTKKYVNDFLPSDGAMPVWMLVSKDGVIEVKHNGAGGDLEDLVEDLLGL